MITTLELTQTGLVLAGITTLETVKVTSNPSLPSVVLTDLEIVTGQLNISGNPALVSVGLAALVFVNRSLDIHGNSALTALDLPSLVTAATQGRESFKGNDCPALANVSFPNYLPSNGHYQLFYNCALTQASVDHILARCVANAGYVTGNVSLYGGTSAAPGTQGALDKATLISRGCTVLTN